MEVSVLPSEFLSVVLEEPNKTRSVNVNNGNNVSKLISDSVTITPIFPNNNVGNSKKVNGNCLPNQPLQTQLKDTPVSVRSEKRKQIDFSKLFPPALLKECIIEITNYSNSSRQNKRVKVPNGLPRKKIRKKSSKIKKTVNSSNDEINIRDVMTNVEAVYSDGGEDSNGATDLNNDFEAGDEDDDDETLGKLVIDETRCNEEEMEDCGDEEEVKMPSKKYVNGNVNSSSGSNCSTSTSVANSSGSASAPSVVTYACDYCPNKYNNKGALWQHSVASHSVEKTCECQLCGRKFYRNCSLALHMKCHSDEQQCSCKVCGKEFSRLSLLEKHTKSHHGDSGSGSSAPQHCCKICNKKFADQGNLQKHMLYHNEKYSCDLCDVTFNKKQLLQMHFDMAHNRGELPFICKLCKARFGNMKELAEHSASHTSEKLNISCQYCNETFTQKSAYKKHLQVHVGDRLRCELCRIDFTQRSSLLRHLKRFHGVNTSHLGSMDAIREKMLNNTLTHNDKLHSHTVKNSSKLNNNVITVNSSNSPSNVYDVKKQNTVVPNDVKNMYPNKTGYPFNTAKYMIKI